MFVIQFLCTIFDFLDSLLDLLDQVFRRRLLVDLLLLLHDVVDLLHSAGELEGHSHSLGDSVRVVDTHAYEVCYLFEPTLVRIINGTDLLVDELNDSIWSGSVLSIDRSDHEIGHIPDLGLVVHLTVEVGFLLSVVADEQLARLEHMS